MEEAAVERCWSPRPRPSTHHPHHDRCPAVDIHLFLGRQPRIVRQLEWLDIVLAFDLDFALGCYLVEWSQETPPTSAVRGAGCTVL